MRGSAAWRLLALGLIVHACLAVTPFGQGGAGKGGRRGRRRDAHGSPAGLSGPAWSKLRKNVRSRAVAVGHHVQHLPSDVAAGGRRSLLFLRRLFASFSNTVHRSVDTVAAILTYLLRQNPYKLMENRPLSWCDDVAHHLYDISAEWDAEDAMLLATLRGLRSTRSPSKLMRMIRLYCNNGKRGGAHAGAVDGAAPREALGWSGASLSRGDKDLTTEDSKPRGMLLVCAMTCTQISSKLFRTILPLMNSLDADAEYWTMMASNPRRVTLEHLAIGGQRRHASLRACTIRAQETRQMAQTMAVYAGQLREALSGILASSTPRELAQALDRLLDVLEDALVDEDGLAGINMTVRRRVRAMRSARMVASEALPRTRACLEEVSQVRQALKHQGSLCAPPPLLRKRWPELVIGTGVGLVMLRQFRLGKDQLLTFCRTSYRDSVIAARRFLDEYITVPATAVYNELFSRDRNSNDWAREAAATREQLDRMVATFNKQRGNKVKGMDGVTKAYEDQIARPIMGVLRGDLLSAALIQVHVVKANLETELASVDAMLRANQLNLQIMAAIPGVFILAIVLQMLRRLLQFIAIRAPQPPRQLFFRLFHRANNILAGESGARESRERSAQWEAQGKLCLVSWRLDQLLSLLTSKEEGEGIRPEITALSDPQLSPQERLLRLEALYRRLRVGGFL